MIPITLVLSTLIIILICRWLFNYVSLWKRLSKIPGPKQYPILGIAWLTYGIPLEDRLTWFGKLSKQYKGGMMIFWLGSIPFISLQKPHLIEKILTSTTHLKKASTYDVMKHWLGEGLLTAAGQTWHHHRRLITPAFHFGVLEEYAAVMRNNVKTLKQLISAECQKNGKDPINIFDIIGRYTLDTICETAMGVHVNAQQQQDNEYCQALYTFARLASDRFLKIWLSSDFIYFRTQNGKKFLECVKILHAFTEKVIIEKQKERAAKKLLNNQESEKKEEDDVFIGKRKPKAFLDLLLDASENAESPLSLKELREEVDTFMFAGQDTTAMGIVNALFALGNAPEIQEKIQEELKEVFGGSTDVATTKELAQLKYLDRVIKESLRLYPSAPIISRNLEEDLELDGHWIPKGTIVSMNIFQTHRNPEIWSDPEKFDPDRFLPENSKGRHAYSHVPFSAGPRNCIGQKFALLELKTVLTAILREWKVTSALKPSEIKMMASITLRPHNGKIDLYFTPLDKH